MNIHKNASMAPKGRAHLVKEIDRMGLKPAAAAAGLSARTARKWQQRYAQEGSAGPQLPTSDLPTAQLRPQSRAGRALAQDSAPDLLDCRSGGTVAKRYCPGLQGRRRSQADSLAGCATGGAL